MVPPSLSETGSAPLVQPFVLGVVGDSGSGKSTVAGAVSALLGEERVTLLELDDYHRFTRAERLEKGLTALAPGVHDLDLIRAHLELLRRGRSIRNRSYEHTDGTFGPTRTLEPREVVLARGLLGFPTEELRKVYDLAVFLAPEAELLFRWKLRRDVKTRGYTEAQVLKRIAQHLLDAKVYVTPQAERADLVVHYEIPEWDAPDAAVRARIALRRAAADALRSDGLPGGLDGGLRMEEEEGGLLLHVDPSVSRQALDAWGREMFPDTYAPDRVGQIQGETDDAEASPVLAFAELLVAHLAQRLRRDQPQPASSGSG